MGPFDLAAKQRYLVIDLSRGDTLGFRLALVPVR